MQQQQWAGIRGSFDHDDVGAVMFVYNDAVYLPILKLEILLPVEKARINISVKMLKERRRSIQWPRRGTFWGRERRSTCRLCV